MDNKIFKNNPLPHFEKAKKEFYRSLSAGKCFISNFALGDARGFKFFGESGNKSAQTGEDLIKNGENIYFYCELPIESEVRLKRDSVLIDNKKGKEIQFNTNKPGIYRVEIYRKRRPWIYSNPIRVLENG